MTTGVLLAYSSFLQANCLAMICQFWQIGVLPHGIVARVMKIIPKKADKFQLMDWRPLTILPIVYKLISKLLAVYFSPQYSKLLINPQQTSFIPGRFIMKNVWLAWMTHDWVVCHRIATLFLKLDFEKAFDQVEHLYIWAVLEAVGLGGMFLKLVKGLLARAI